MAADTLFDLGQGAIVKAHISFDGAIPAQVPVRLHGRREARKWKRLAHFDGGYLNKRASRRETCSGHETVAFRLGQGRTAPLALTPSALRGAAPAADSACLVRSRQDAHEGSRRKRQRRQDAMPRPFRLSCVLMRRTRLIRWERPRQSPTFRGNSRSQCRIGPTMVPIDCPRLCE